MALDPKFTATVDDGVKNADWDKYDDLIRKEVAGYNQRFSTTPGYAQVDWKLLKAMIWIESGGPHQGVWNSRVMQIGVGPDPGYRVLKAGEEGSSVIMDEQLRADIKSGNIADPRLNIRAGIAYVFTRMAQFTMVSVEDPSDRFDHQYLVKSGETPWTIARKLGTTLEELAAKNPPQRAALLAGKVHPKQALLYRRASRQLTVSGWLAFTGDNLASRYNGGTDPSYAEKLNYVLQLFTRLDRRTPSKPAPVLPSKTLPVILVLILSSLAANAQDFSRTRIYDAMKAARVIDGGSELIHFSHTCTLLIDGAQFPVIDVREGLPGGFTPRGYNYIVLLSAALKPVQKLEYITQRPLFCLENRLYIWGDLAINNIQPEGDVLTFTDHGKTIHLRHVEPNEYPLPITADRKTPPQ